MTTDIKTLTTSEAAARVGITGQYMRFLLSKGKGPKGCREGNGVRGAWYFTVEDIDVWDTARVKRAKKVNETTEMAPAKLERLEAAGWKAGSAEVFLGTGDGVSADPTDLTVLAT